MYAFQSVQRLFPLLTEAAVLPSNNDDLLQSAIAPEAVTKTALRLRYQICEVIPCELEEWKIEKANSPIITPKVLRTAKEAGGKDNGSCVVYCLLVCNRWFRKQAGLELWDADMHNARATACEVMAKLLIESEEDQDYLLQDLLLKRYSILINGEMTEPANVIERAVDLHCLRIIGSSGYQKCISYLWRGWLIQDEGDPSRFVPYTHKATADYYMHLDPNRMRTPLYQNSVQIFFSLLFLVLYTSAINTINSTGDLDVVEGILYIMTFGFLCDEASKFWKVGRYYIGFWNVFNLILYGLLTTSFILRLIALSHGQGDDVRRRFNILSYNFLAFSAPMFWMRLLLYLDTFRFFGAMLVVLKVMMKESLIFFALLIIVMVGFLQAFIGMDQVDDNSQVTAFIMQAMANAVLQSPDFDGFENFAWPFGLILYYIFTFVVMVGKYKHLPKPCCGAISFFNILSLDWKEMETLTARLEAPKADYNQSFSISSLPSTTVHTKTSLENPLTSTWRSSLRKPRSSSVHRTKTYSLLVSSHIHFEILWRCLQIADLP